MRYIVRYISLRMAVGGCNGNAAKARMTGPVTGPGSGSEVVSIGRRAGRADPTCSPGRPLIARAMAQRTSRTSGIFHEASSSEGGVSFGQ